jgi:hypothetical protein
LNGILDRKARNKRRRGQEEIEEEESGLSFPDSSVKWNDVAPVLVTRSYVQRVQGIASVDLLIDYLTIVRKVAGPVAAGKEAKRLHFIFPVLAIVCATFENVEILIEEDVNGQNVHVNGHFEFILKREGKCICIVEAKKTDMIQGKTQVLLGCEALVDVEKLEAAYGIVTNYLEWFFFNSLNNVIFEEQCSLAIDNSGVPRRDSINEIAGKICAMLIDA